MDANFNCFDICMPSVIAFLLKFAVDSSQSLSVDRFSCQSGSAAFS